MFTFHTSQSQKAITLVCTCSLLCAGTYSSALNKHLSFLSVQMHKAGNCIQMSEAPEGSAAAKKPIPHPSVTMSHLNAKCLQGSYWSLPSLPLPPHQLFTSSPGTAVTTLLLPLPLPSLTALVLSLRRLEGWQE